MESEGWPALFKQYPSIQLRFKDKLFEDKVKITIKKRERKISPLKREKEPSDFIGEVNILSLLMFVRAVMKSNLLKKTVLVLGVITPESLQEKSQKFWLSRKGH